jgi:hypothetical protein
VKKHLGAGRDGLRIGQPLVECLLVPHDLGGFERVGIVVIGQGGCLAPEYAAMARPDIVLVERVAVLAGLLERLAASGVAGQPTGPYGPPKGC